MDILTAEQVKALRNLLGESQKQFADRFGVNQSTVNRWEAKGIPRGTARVAVGGLLENLRKESKKETAQ